MLTENQKNYLLDTFFKNEKFAGWRSIATKLLETGKCIVPGERCIWLGGVGNFISTKDSDIAVGCLEYSFDLEYFKTSEHYKTIHAELLKELQQQADNINKGLAELRSL